tara:strand:- start:413 stop:1582 length:1170 start_codon:yes stop_codon:yes gene_type:complete
MYILGINISHHPSVALLKDGELLFYLEDDRLNKIKEEEWNADSKMHCFQYISHYTRHIDHIIFSSVGKDTPYRVTDNVLVEWVKDRLDLYGIEYGESHLKHAGKMSGEYCEHHLYHATNAFYWSEFEEAAALILDGSGVPVPFFPTSKEVESTYYLSGTNIEEIGKNFSHFYFDGAGIEPSLKKPFRDGEYNKYTFSSTMSCGILFLSMCGVTGIDTPGKVMGISPYGNLEDAGDEEWFIYDEEVGIWITDNETIFNNYNRCYEAGSTFNPLPHTQPALFHHFYKQKPDFNFQVAANLSKKLQVQTKNHTIRLIRELLEKVDTKNLVLSGGYFLNCVNNYEYVKEFPDVNFFIDPCAHDGGTSIGAARYLWHFVMKNEMRDPLKTLFLG